MNECASVKQGDRVRFRYSAYTGPGRRKGDTGTVVRVYANGNADVRTDVSDECGEVWAFLYHELEVME